MSKAKKVLILTLTMIFAIAVSATIVSFSFAGGASKDADPSLAAANDAASSGDANLTVADKLTNIDHIIDKANDASLSDEERVFHIVQIVSNGKKNTSLKSYVESGDFAKYVINNNRSTGHAEMPATVNGQSSVQIDVLTVQDLRNIVTTKPIDYSRINIADLIYISNDPADPFVGGDVNTGNQGNDIPEDIHKLIQPYVAGDNKPLIIDNEGVAGDVSNPYSMNSLVSNVLAPNYIKYRTFGWKSSVSMEDFLKRNGSVFIPLEITDQNYVTSKVLVVTGDGNSNTMYNTITGDTQTFINNAFYRKGYKPTSIDVTSISYSSITDSSFADGYDFVFIENDTYNAMTQTIYNAISAVSFAKKHVIYADSLKTTGTSSGSDNDSNYKELYTMVVSEEGIAKQSNVYVSSYTFFDAMVADPAGTQEAANAIAALLKASTYREFGAGSASDDKYYVLEIQPAYPIDTELAEKNNSYYTVPSNVYKSSKETTPEGKEYYAFELTKEKIMALTGLDASDIELVQVSTEELQGMKISITDKYDMVYIGGNISAMNGPSTYKIDASYTLDHYVDTEYQYVTAVGKKAGDVISASESVDGKEHTVEGLNKQWPAYTVKYILLERIGLSSADYPVGSVIPASLMPNNQQGTVSTITLPDGSSAIGVNLGWDCPIPTPDYASGATVPADKSVDGQEHVANTSTWATIAVYSVPVSHSGLAFYQMYSHSGMLIKYNSYIGNPYLGGSTGSYANAGGNDLTAKNLENLKAYIDAGMPIVFSDDITQAYLSLKEYKSAYENQLIDPDSNMYKLLAYAFEGKNIGSQDKDGKPISASYELKTVKNVLADFDKDDTIRISNLSGEYGDTSISGADYVEVFNDGVLVPYMMKNASGKWEDYAGSTNPDAGNAGDTAGGKLKALIAQNVARPIMHLTKMPNEYVANTPSSYLQSPSLNFEFELMIQGMLQASGNSNIVSFTVTLYVDDNSNGLFTDKGENVKSVTVQVGSNGKATGALSYEMASDFYGPVSWKIEAVANLKKGTQTVSGPSISYNAVSKVARTTQEKELVHILQIMPKGMTQQDKTTLYFCTECQLSNTNAMFNLHLNSSPEGTGVNFVNALYQNYEARGSMPTLVNDTGLNTQGNVYRSREDLLKLIKSAEDVVNSSDGDYFKCEHFGIGLHTHNFGIWKYDSDLGYDDWNSNLADTLLGEDGDFEFKIDVFGPEDLDAMNKEYCNNDVAKLQNAYETAKKGGDETAIADAKQALDTLQNSKLEQAALLYEKYENLVQITEDKEQDLKIILQYFVDHEAEISGKYGGIKDYSIFAEVLGNGKYYDIFSQNKTAWRDNDPTNDQWKAPIVFTAEKLNAQGVMEDKEYRIDQDYAFCKYYYQNWADAKSKEILMLELYWDTMRAAYGKDWMKEIYGMVLVGAAEDFNDQDLTQSVCDTLADYEKSQGNMLMFHDTMAKKADGAVNVTNTLRDAFGLNRYHMTTSSTDADQYEVQAKYSADKYFLTRMTIGDTGKMRSVKLGKDQWNTTTYTRTLVGMSTAFTSSNGSNVTAINGKNVYGGLPYKYAIFYDAVAVTWMQDFKTYQTNMATGSYGTNRATQINNGIITSYPFKISDKLNISGTHNQYLALDVEDDEVITWYALAAANNKKEGSSIYAADPADSSDNYFIYSKGNVSYCGAGHAKVTGPLTDNNDERMLFINIICNSARKNALKPSIKVYDPDNKKPVPSAGNKYILQNGDGEPYIEVSSQEESIKFGFLATVDTTASETIKKVRLYFKYKNADNEDVEEVVGTFPDAANKIDALESGIDYYVNSTDNTNKKIADSIKLKPEYFGGYDDCAYIYIEVTDSNDEILVEKIRIDLVRDLFDLTKNTVEEAPAGTTLLDYIKDL